MSSAILRNDDFESATAASRRIGAWKSSAWEDFRAIINDPAFPCFFASSADKRGSLRYCFIEDPRSETDLRLLGNAVTEYLEEVREIEERSVTDAAFQILIVFVKTPQPISLEDEQTQGWEILSRLHLLDSKPWPKHVATDPEDTKWSFCWDGVPLFVNISASAHKRRKSRRLGRHLALVIQPRDAFDSIAGNTPSGRKLREKIRKRIKPYDGVSACPLLGTYGESGSLEWLQYAIPDQNGPLSEDSRCPFVGLVEKYRRLQHQARSYIRTRYEDLKSRRAIA